MLILERLIKDNRYQFPSFMKDRPFYIEMELTRPNRGGVSIYLKDCDIGQTIVKVDLPEHMWMAMLEEYLYSSFGFLGFKTNKCSFTNILEHLNTTRKLEYTYKEEFDPKNYERPNEQEDPDLDRPVAPRRQPQLRPPRMVDQPLRLDRAAWAPEDQAAPIFNDRDLDALRRAGADARHQPPADPPGDRPNDGGRERPPRRRE